ncbi:MAG: capsular biosynthesis protein [bacterium]|nr:capsular biosynthesis protein [bacterium]
MKIIIPMTGEGKRFLDQGYTQIKPLIPIHGKPMISYVIDLFPGEKDFVFICREEHLNKSNLESVLKNLMPSGKILSQKGKKLGPVVPLLESGGQIADDEPVIVSYCDYFLDWNYSEFKKQIIASGCDGNVICYTGHHPHLRHKKNIYAGCKVDAKNNLLQIQEKHSFEKNKEAGHHSAGLYYFKCGSYIKKYGTQLVEEENKINGEYFVSMLYHYMLKDSLNIQVYDKVPHFCQWGTPEDLEEYIYWSQIFRDNQ